MQQDTMFQLAERLKALRDEKREAEDNVKRLNAEIDAVDEQLSALMIDGETQNFTRSGTLFCLTTATRASAVAGNKDALFAALKRAGFGDLVYETVNANSLSAFVKERISENDDALPAWLDELVNVYDRVTVGVRKASR